MRRLRWVADGGASEAEPRALQGMLKRQDRLGFLGIAGDEHLVVPDLLADIPQEHSR